MKLLNKTIVLLLTLTLLMPTLVSAKGGGRKGVNKRQAVTNVLPASQADTLLWMREEEKLARDVYLALADEWKQPIFENIAASEQKHMDAILKKINSFGLTDPAKSSEGDFTDPDIQALYTQLVSQGEEGYIAALNVGLTIEDMDIADLINAIDETDNIGLKTTYQSLLEGSKNHLRAFNRLMLKQGITYEPVYISQKLFDAIINF